MSRIASQPSYVTLPDCGPPYPPLLHFLEQRFPKVGRQTWRERLKHGKISDDWGNLMTEETLYQPNLRLRYYREVAMEPDIPFHETILFQNSRILVVDKPHFLPVTPAGPYVTQCLLARLKASTGIDELAPLHRIDRETAGLVLFSVNKATRGAYHELFSSGNVHKMYDAVGIQVGDASAGAVFPCSTSDYSGERAQKEMAWQIRCRIAEGVPWFRVKRVDGDVNAVSNMTLITRRGEFGHFRLEPLTGKQHQLRLHLTLLGWQILYDRYYPTLQPKRPDDFSRPLQLLAKELRFIDPISREPLEFQSQHALCSFDVL